MPGLWGKRLVALIIDALIITLLLWVIVAVIYPVIVLLNLLVLFNIWVPLAPGKNVMKLKVRAIKGEIGYKKTLIRNLSKILWFPLVVDVIVGFAMGKPRERYLDRLAKTEVVKTEEVEDPQKNLEQSTSSD